MIQEQQFVVGGTGKGDDVGPVVVGVLCLIGGVAGLPAILGEVIIRQVVEVAEEGQRVGSAYCGEVGTAIQAAVAGAANTAHANIITCIRKESVDGIAVGVDHHGSQVTDRHFPRSLAAAGSPMESHAVVADGVERQSGGTRAGHLHEGEVVDGSGRIGT